MSSTFLRRTAALPVAVLATALTTSLLGAAPAAAQQAPTTSPAVRAGDWLAGQLNEDGLVTQSFGGEEFLDYGRSLDAAIALLAARTQTPVLRRTLAGTSTPEAVAAYTQGAPFDRPDAAYVGATAKLAFVVGLTGGDATDVGDVDLLAQLDALATPEGRFADRSLFGSFANLFGHSFALLAQQAAGRTVPSVQVEALAREQCADGGFAVSYSGGECRADVDATGLVLQALAAVGAGATPGAGRAVTWLRGQQQSDGGFPGEVRQNSTGYAAAGLLAVDPASRAAADAVAYLRTQQNADGGLSGPEQGQSDAFATSQALPALAGSSFRAAARDERLFPLCDAAPALRFSDVPGDDVHADAIACLSGLDVVRGGSDGRFRPAEVVTRAQTASLLARALDAAGVELPEDGPRFADVPAGDVHRAAISALAELGVVRGRTTTSFEPDVPVRRDQMAALLARAYAVATGQELPEGQTPFTDVSGVHAADIGRITAAGVTSGTTATTYSPERVVARGSMASFVARATNLAVSVDDQAAGASGR